MNAGMRVPVTNHADALLLNFVVVHCLFQFQRRLQQVKKRTHVTGVAIFHLVFSGCWMRVVQILFYLTVVDSFLAANTVYQRWRVF
jgi:hypothetical protein